MTLRGHAPSSCSGVGGVFLGFQLGSHRAESRPLPGHETPVAAELSLREAGDKATWGRASLGGCEPGGRQPPLESGFPRGEPVISLCHWEASVARAWERLRTRSR